MIIRNLNQSKLNNNIKNGQDSFLYNKKLRKGAMFLLIASALTFILNACDIIYFFINPSLFLQSLLDNVVEIFDFSYLPNEELAVIFKYLLIAYLVLISITLIISIVSFLIAFDSYKYAKVKPEALLSHKGHIIAPMIISFILFINMKGLMRFICLIAAFYYIGALKDAKEDAYLINKYGEYDVIFNDGIPSKIIDFSDNNSSVDNNDSNEEIKENENINQDPKRLEFLNEMYQKMADLEHDYHLGLIDEETYLNRKKELFDSFMGR